MMKKTVLMGALLLPLAAMAAPATATSTAANSLAANTEQPAPNLNPSRSDARTQLAACEKAAKGLAGAKKQKKVQACMRSATTAPQH